jgi:hypothetical protein
MRMFTVVMCDSMNDLVRNWNSVAWTASVGLENELK